MNHVQKQNFEKPQTKLLTSNRHGMAEPASICVLLARLAYGGFSHHSGAGSPACDLQ